MPVPAPELAATNVQAQNEGSVKSTIKSIARGILIVIGVQYIIGHFAGKKSNPNNSSIDTVNLQGDSVEIPPYFTRPKSLEDGVSYSYIPHKIAPIWPLDSLLDIIIVISPSSISEPISNTPSDRVVVNEKSFQLSNYSDERVISVSFDVPAEVQNNGTLWGHFYIGMSGENLDPSISDYNPGRAFNFKWPLTQYILQKRPKKTKNLLAGHDENKDPVEQDISTHPIIVSHYHPNFTMSFVPDTGVLDFVKIHPAMKQYFHLESNGARDATGRNSWYYPVLFINTFWQLKSQMIPLNKTTENLPLHINLNNIANWKFSVISSIDEGAKQAAQAAAQGASVPGGGDGSEFEMIKEVLLDTNPYLLGTTVVVSILHMIFEMLAFKSDISHYRNKKNNVGISVRSILGNVFMQTVILLYLLDNNESTSWMILFSQGMGVVLELWKITTVVDVRIRPSNNMIGSSIVFEDKHVLSATEEKTKEYDAVAFKYLYMIAIPLLIAYALYSITYETHKSWYSFIIATLVGSVYAYGFLMMVPSLYINYRLKSVAHMPAKAMTYKFLNTFIDDLFAFTIKMPTLHRLATLRDDLIFFVYLYQSWKYKTDYSRVNEFGQGGDDVDVKKAIESTKASESDVDVKVSDIKSSNLKKDLHMLDSGVSS